MENEITNENLSFGEKIKCFFINPSKLFASIKEKPIYIVPFIIAVVVAIFNVVITFTLGKEAMIESVTESLKGNPAADTAINIATSPAMMVIGVITGSAGVLIGIVISALIYWAFAKLFKGEIKITEMISVSAVCYITTAIGSLIKTLYLLIANNPIVASTKVASATFTDILINSVNIFTIWKMVLLVFGISVVANLSKKKAIAVVLIVFTLGVLFSYGSLWVSTALQSIQPTA
jgi:hypothetical protein